MSLREHLTGALTEAENDLRRHMSSSFTSNVDDLADRLAFVARTNALAALLAAAAVRVQLESQRPEPPHA